MTNPQTTLEEMRSELERLNSEHSQAWKDFNPADRIMHKLLTFLINESKVANVG